MSEPTEPPPLPGSSEGLSPPHTKTEGIADAVMNVVVPGFDKKMNRILQDMDEEAVADKRMLETEDRLLAERPSAEDAGVDISELQAADPTFNDQDFLAVARDCFERIREARSRDNPQFVDAELSPQLAQELKDIIAGDVASHRHHLLPGLEIRSALIEQTWVTDGNLGIVVRFHLQAEEVDVDLNGHVLAGDYTERSWEENWTFSRDPAIDPPDLDNAMSFVPLEQGGWLFAHKGWIVVSIERVGAPDPLDPTNL